MADEKKYLRLILSESRNALSPGVVRKLSARIQALLIAHPGYRRARQVVLYAPKDNEVLTDLIFADALGSGRAVFFPRLGDAEHGLELAKVDNPAELRPGAYGILEPDGAEVTDPAALSEAMICVPGLIFSPHGERIGRGRGHYDRLLSRLGSSVITAGLAYSFQLLDPLPQAGLDQRLDLIVTESTIHVSKSSALSTATRVEQGGVLRWS